MQDFIYFTPTLVVFGKETEQQVGSLVARQGGKKVLVHYGGGSAEKSGLLARVYASLQEANIPCVSLGGVRPNPGLSLVRQGIDLCRKEGVDFLLAVGGGSVIDSAKAIGYGLASGGDVWDFYTQKREPTAMTPVGVVLTIAAAGSEMSSSSVITNETTGEKRGYKNHILARPRFAVMNPELTYSVPPYQTAAGCADILMHTVERYFTPDLAPMDITDDIAEALMRNVMENARVLARNPSDAAARVSILWAGSLSHNGLTGCGNGEGDWAVHQLGHELSAKYGLAHGASLTAVWGAWARYVYRANVQRFSRFAVNVMGIPSEESGSEELAVQGIEELEGFFWGIEMPTSLKEAGIQPAREEIAELAERCSFYGKRSIGTLQALRQEDMVAIYTMAKG